MVDSEIEQAILELRKCCRSPMDQVEERIYRRNLAQIDRHTFKGAMDAWVRRGTNTRPSPTEFFEMVQVGWAEQRRAAQAAGRTQAQDLTGCVPMPNYVRDQITELRQRRPGFRRGGAGTPGVGSSVPGRPGEAQNEPQRVAS